ncbi:MAG: hypothetical protein AAB036_04335 [Elusimicrobiota bacterium]
MTGTNALVLVFLLAANGVNAEDWLAEAERTAREAAIHGLTARGAPQSPWTRWTPNSRLFSGEIPTQGWWPMEEESWRGPVFFLLGPDSPSAALRATLSVRFYDKDTPGYAPIKKAVDLMRRDNAATRRSMTPVRPLRVGLGLARTFEIVETRRLPMDDAPSFEEEIHQYVAVIPVGEAYYLVRLISSRSTYLEYRDDFVRFIKSLRAVSGR